MKNITGMWPWMRVQFFRFWTALVVLGACGFFWLNTPEYLTWWKRTVSEERQQHLSFLADEAEKTLRFTCFFRSK